MHLEKKKKQHFVWRKYLRQWATKERVFCLMDNRVLNPGLMKIGQEKYFYKLKELTDKELKFLKDFVDHDKNAIIRQVNHGWIVFFNKIFEIKKLLNNEGVSHPEIDKMLDVTICNFEEDFHCHIESEGEKFLDKLYAKDIAFYENEEELISFLFFICQQYFRTQKINENMRATIGSFNGFNIDALWAVLRHISATNVGYNLYKDREKFHPILIENGSGISFVTGDQPIINTHATGLGLDEIPDKLEFYYPLTPSLAFLLTDDDQYADKTIVTASEVDVIEYNRYIYEQAGKQVYASDRNALELLLKT